MRPLIVYASIILGVLFGTALHGWAQGPPNNPCPIESYGNNPSVGRRTAINGVDVYYEEYGRGEPLLLIHGNGGSIRAMRCQIRDFARKYRVIASDSRSHGNSGGGTGPLTYAQMADDLAGLLDYLRLERVAVLGHSDGANVALLLGSRHPQKISRIVASSPGFSELAVQLHPETVKALYAQVAETEAMIEAGDQSRDWHIRRRQLSLMEDIIPLSVLDRITAPTLIVAADGDSIRLEHIVEIYRRHPNAHVFVMPEATHAMLPDERYNSAVERFLTRPFNLPGRR